MQCSLLITGNKDLRLSFVKDYLKNPNIYISDNAFVSFVQNFCRTSYRSRRLALDALLPAMSNFIRDKHLQLVQKSQYSWNLRNKTCAIDICIKHVSPCLEQRYGSFYNKYRR